MKNTSSSKNSSTAPQIASMLLEIEAVKLRPHEPFTWASGWKSPIYCDNRLTLSFPSVREFITTSLTDQIKSHFSDVTVIAGVATAGIPQAALVAEALNLPMIYIRSKPKDHGTQSQIEGKLNVGDKVVLIEDLISTGKSSLAAAQVIKDAGVNVIGMAAIFTYGFEQAKQNFADAKIPLQTLCDYAQLIEQAKEQQFIQEEDISMLVSWRENPAIWGK